MQILINTHSNIKGSEQLNNYFKGVVENTLDKFKNKITHVDVHLTDLNGTKGGTDKHCSIEASISGVKHTAVTYEAETLDKAVHGAAHKLKNAIDHTLGKLKSRPVKIHIEE